MKILIILSFGLLLATCSEPVAGPDPHHACLSAASQGRETLLADMAANGHTPAESEALWAALEARCDW